MLPLVLALAVAPAPAAPEGAPPASKGLVVRVDAAGETTTGPVTVTLTGEGGDAVTLELNDRGESGDSNPSDGVWSGSKWLVGDRYSVAVRVGDREIGGGVAEWPETVTARDLDVAVQGDRLRVSTAAAPSGEARAPAAGNEAMVAADAAAPTGVAAPGGGAGAASGGGTGVATVPPAAAASSGSIVPYLVIGVGVVAIAAGVLLGRGRKAEGRSEPAGAPLPAAAGVSAGAPRRSAAVALPVPFPSPGLFGHGTPSLDEGVSLWEIPAADARALADALLATVAATRPVVWVGPPGLQPARVHGGPVYPCPVGSPEEAAKLLVALEERGPAALVALLPGVGPDTLAAWTRVAPAPGGGVVVTDDAADAVVPVVQCRRAGLAEYTFSTAEATVRARLGRLGLDPVG